MWFELPLLARRKSRGELSTSIRNLYIYPMGATEGSLEWRKLIRSRFSDVWRERTGMCDDQSGILGWLWMLICRALNVFADFIWCSAGCDQALRKKDTLYPTNITNCMTPITSSATITCVPCSARLADKGLSSDKQSLLPRIKIKMKAQRLAARSKPSGILSKKI